MLEYDVRELLKDPQLVIEVEDRPDPSFMESLRSVPAEKMPTIRGAIRNLDGTVLEFAGTIDTTLVLPCSRCAEDVRVPMHIEASQRYISSAACKAEEESDEEAEVFDEYRLNLTDFVRDELILNVPMKVLCRDDCKGLCPQCGKNLNAGSCGCSSELPDDRWNVLKDLLQSQNIE